jgi:hypothetical protein
MDFETQRASESLQHKGSGIVMAALAYLREMQYERECARPGCG